MTNYCRTHKAPPAPDAYCPTCDQYGLYLVDDTCQCGDILLRA